MSSASAKPSSVFLAATSTALAIWFCYCYNLGNLFGWHVTTVVLGVLPALNGGVAVILQKRSYPEWRRYIVWTHAVLESLMIAAIGGGTALMYAFRDSMGKTHFHSWHSWLAVVLLAIAPVQLLTGALLLFSWLLKAIASLTGSPSSVGGLRSWSVSVHMYNAIAVYICVAVTIAYGLKPWLQEVRHGLAPLWRMVMFCAVLAVTVVACWQIWARRPAGKQGAAGRNTGSDC